MKEDHKVELHKYREELVRQKENWSEKTDLSGSWRKKKIFQDHLKKGKEEYNYGKTLRDMKM